MRRRVKGLEKEVEMGTKRFAAKTHDLAVAEDKQIEEQCEVNQHCVATRVKLYTANAQVKSLRSELADSNVALEKTVRRLEKSKGKRGELEVRVEGP
jgi:hypothetical protein